MTNLKIDIMMGNDESWAKFKKITTRYFRQSNSNRKKKFTVLKIVRGKRYGNWRNLKITAKCSLGVLENRRIKLGIENARGWEVLCKPVHRPQRGVLWPYMQPVGCSYSGVWGQVQSKQKAIPFLWEPSGLLVKSQPAEGLGNALC